MSEFYGDLIVPAIDPLDRASRLTSLEVGAELRLLAGIADEAGLADLWAGAALIGSDRALEPPRARGSLGISLAHASMAGIGFWRDHRLSTELPANLLQDLAGGSEHRKRVAAALLEKAQREVEIRSREVNALEHVAALANGRLRFPVSLELDIWGSWPCDFPIAYRRRIAYALGFEASILAKSLVPYEALQPLLVAGSAASFSAALPDRSQRGAISIHLNLAARLHAIVSAQGENTVLEAAEKQASLEAGLFAATESCASAEGVDGRIALTALRLELKLTRETPAPYVSTYPLWGSIAGAAAYGEPKAGELPQ